MRAPVHTLATRYCIWDSRAVSVCFKVCQYKTNPYSIVERTHTLYKISKVALLRYLTLRNTASFLLALRQALWICLAHDNVELKNIPRCLCPCTCSIKESLKISGGELKRTLFSEKITSLLLPALNCRFCNRFLPPNKGRIKKKNNVEPEQQTWIFYQIMGNEGKRELRMYIRVTYGNQRVSTLIFFSAFLFLGWECSFKLLYIMCKVFGWFHIKAPRKIWQLFFFRFLTKKIKKCLIF